MKTYVSPGQRPDTATVVAVGSFDGVHLGHQALIAQLKAKAREHRVPSVVYTFDPPTRVLTQGVEFLSTLPEKLDLLARYGVDETIAAAFTPEFASRPKEAFLDDLRLLRPRAIVVGEDFHFGRGRAGSAADLREVAPEVVVVPIHGLSGEDIKSTRVREYLKSGDVDGARRLLGRHYDAQGVVVQGDRLGRTIGWPTANIRVPDGKALPLGVFAVVAVGDHGRWHGMANVGFRPTVNGTDRRFEVHLFDFSGDLYGQEVQVKFFTHLRGEQKFSGLDELKAQIARDAQAARDALKDVR
ncbi:riboflavin biosynthesis protein RibF [Deinococcus soli (ex Cha et al. 2016)]|uniref:Riboflavin biosynthesis protein n=2 Tax=Deinococcus soli (ex Cha et al. 2016) TaxID=1309411 RepID=A0AAE3X9K7_9DEIO|nr:riboflavin biosynthesis protein RibF [Deinococcus soli (ex Cha et al. 2016)]MDR6216923.1 riboflavin kinase/FMN adenylyltransferase [Deinococcus soli (ex Cha et al. 2016)]MDR6327744.1 riboflavin kinase/FMN adenylyltransferase [Deinococcus soli (ex Cha et al. 2016)]MDR6750019.1 riboflavin kinase/FMN adenylyltransferase [Deinococcus soli (ex Cha et al. 2016)]